jgi:hypothetical protein
MMDGINGSQSMSPMDQSRARVSENAPPSGEPMGTESMRPDVTVAISDLAQARMDTMHSPQSNDSMQTMQSNTSNGGIEFGVDKGGFAWPLAVDDTSPTEGAGVDSMDAWTASKQAVNGIILDEDQASESAYIALGKSSVNAAE